MESTKQEIEVIVKEPRRLYDAIQAFREVAESIEFQQLYGDELRPPTKKEFDQFSELALEYFHRILTTLDALHSRVSQLEERSEFEDELHRAEGELSALDLVPPITWGPRPPGSDYSVSISVPANPNEFVYLNADIEDGFGKGSSCHEPCCPSRCGCQEEQAEHSQQPGVYSGLAGDECNCRQCR